jgi:hypothetical protein
VTSTIATTHLLAMTDGTGVAQHARFLVPNRDHGYCVDDNARALLVMVRLAALRPLSEAESRAARTYAAYVDHSWDERTRSFRNFMNYARQWLDTAGDDDAEGRTFWALSETYAMPPEPHYREWARCLLDESIMAMRDLKALRSWAFVLLGLDRCLAADPSWPEAKAVRRELAGRLRSRYEDAARPDWTWWEPTLGYDNTRIPEAAMLTGRAVGDETLFKAGLDSLVWLNEHQFDGGMFHPVGNESFHRVHEFPARFDQQPIEAAATVDACLVAERLTGDGTWGNLAEAAFAWFEGHNDIGASLGDPATGSCHDGLHADGVNANAGAESTLSYLLAQCAMQMRGA